MSLVWRAINLLFWLLVTVLGAGFVFLVVATAIRFVWKVWQ